MSAPVRVNLPMVACPDASKCAAADTLLASQASRLPCDTGLSAETRSQVMLLYRKTAELKARALFTSLHATPSRLPLFCPSFFLPSPHRGLFARCIPESSCVHVSLPAPGSPQAQAVAEYVEELIENGAGKFLLFAHHKASKALANGKGSSPVT